jgi:hypothetical protein
MKWKQKENLNMPDNSITTSVNTRTSGIWTQREPPKDDWVAEFHHFWVGYPRVGHMSVNSYHQERNLHRK